nr:CDP-glycerol glycerophosphotransferase family protein [Lactiplantibacillus plantarum]
MKDKFRIILADMIAQIFNLVIRTNPNVWIFSSTGNKHYNYNAKYFFEYVLSKHKEKKIYFVVNDMEVREKLNREVGNYFISSITFSGIITILKGSIWITSAGLPIHLVFDLKHRSVINLWHGVPLKKIVLLENHLNWLKKLYVKVFFSRRYTAIATTSINMLETYAASFGVPDNVVKVLGQPRNDLLSFDNKAQFNNVFPNIRGRKILYAPTYREWGETRLFPFADFNQSEFEQRLQELDATVFIRFHIENQTQQVKRVKESNRIRFINEDKFEDIMTVLNVFDLLITDYSSIYIDYLLLDKPIIFLPYDLQEYSTRRGFNFKYDEVTPGEKVYDSSKQFENAVTECLNHPSRWTNERKRADDYFNKVKFNNCKRVYDFIDSGSDLSS